MVGQAASLDSGSECPSVSVLGQATGLHSVGVLMEISSGALGAHAAQFPLTCQESEGKSVIFCDFPGKSLPNCKGSLRPTSPEHDVGR